MSYVVIGVRTATMGASWRCIPRHKVLVEELRVGAWRSAWGRFRTGQHWHFPTLEAAKEFIQRDPFNLEGLVKVYTIREWTTPTSLGWSITGYFYNVAFCRYRISR